LQENARTEAGRAIVMVTLNHGRRRISDEATRDALWRANITLSAITPKDGAAPAREGPDVGNVLPLVDATGGDAFEMDKRRIPLAEVLQRLRERYLVTYRIASDATKTVHSDADITNHKIGVDLTPDAKARLQDAQIHARGGYMSLN
jgi:hypothetical protein